MAVWMIIAPGVELHSLYAVEEGSVLAEKDVLVTLDHLKVGIFQNTSRIASTHSKRTWGAGRP